MPILRNRTFSRSRFKESITVRRAKAGSRSADGAWTEGSYEDYVVDAVSMPGEGGIQQELIPAGLRKSQRRWFYFERDAQPLRPAANNFAGADRILRGTQEFIVFHVQNEDGWNKVLGVVSEAVGGTRTSATVDKALRKFVLAGSGLPNGHVIDAYDAGPAPTTAYATAKLMSAELQGGVENTPGKLRAAYLGEAEACFKGPGSVETALKFLRYAASDTGQDYAAQIGLTIHNADNANFTGTEQGSEFEDEATVNITVGFTAQDTSTATYAKAGSLVIWNDEKIKAEPAINFSLEE